MGRKYLSTDSPTELSALNSLIASGHTIELTHDDMRWVTLKAYNRMLDEAEGHGIQNAPYDQENGFKRQYIGLLGEFATYRFITTHPDLASAEVKWDTNRNYNTYDLLVSGRPYGVKTVTIDDVYGYHVPQVDKNRIHHPQAIVYTHINNPAYITPSNVPLLKIYWVKLIAVVSVEDIIAGTDSEWGTSANPNKGGFIAFSKIPLLNKAA